MTLDELDITSESFFEDEEDALNELPRDRQGMELLLSYLSGIDGSIQAWGFLMEQFSSLMSESEYLHYKQCAQEAGCPEELFLFIES